MCFYEFYILFKSNSNLYKLKFCVPQEKVLKILIVYTLLLYVYFKTIVY